MTTYYCTTIEEALRRVKRAVKTVYPGSYYGGITFLSRRKGFAVYWEGKVVEPYTARRERKGRLLLEDSLDGRKE